VRSRRTREQEWLSDHGGNKEEEEEEEGREGGREGEREREGRMRLVRASPGREKVTRRGKDLSEAPAF